jgi:hypothetical protein
MNIFNNYSSVESLSPINLSDSEIHPITEVTCKTSSPIARYLALLLCLFLEVYEAQAGQCVTPPEEGGGRTSPLVPHYFTRLIGS